MSICVHVIPDGLVCRTRTRGEINARLVASGLQQQRKQIKKMFVDTFIIVYFTLKIPTRCDSVSKFYFSYLYEARNVAGDTPPIIRSIKLH